MDEENVILGIIVAVVIFASLFFGSSDQTDYCQDPQQNTSHPTSGC